MQITVAALVAAGIAVGEAQTFVAPLQLACDLVDINTGPRIAAFIAQCGHESAGFVRLEENLNYTHAERICAVWPRSVPSLAIAQRLVNNPEALANLVYAKRNGNGDIASGDGYRYRGRGLLQITGRQNYAEAAAEIGRDYLEQPDLVAQPEDACLTAARYWRANKLNALADGLQIDDITRRINGPAMDGALQRRQRFAAALKAFT